MNNYTSTNNYSDKANNFYGHSLNHPFGVSTRGDHAVEGVARVLLFGRDRFHVAFLDGLLEFFEKEAAKQSRHDPDREEEPFAARHPPFAVGGESAPRHETMHVGMEPKVLSPRV